MTAPGCIGCEWVNACHNHELACDAFEHWHQREAVDNALRELRDVTGRLERAA